MTEHRLRGSGLALSAGVGMGLLALALAISPVRAHADDATLIMGGTGDPDPPTAYLTGVYDNYILPNITPQGAILTALVTPEQGYPVYGTLTFDASVAQGVGDLRQAVTAEPSGTDTIVFGFSQSATIVTDYLDEVANGSVKNPPHPSEVRFVLAGDPNNPDGGLFERFDGFYYPGYNETYNGATPDLAYPTDIYTLQYDGYGDFPRYPLDLLADLNAAMGADEDHLGSPPVYESLTPAQVATAIVEPVSPGATGDTTYYMILTQGLPLLEPLVKAGAPQWLVDLIEPDLRVLVDLGYGNIGGPDTEYANLPTPASLFELVNPVTTGMDLIKGAAQGVTAALVDTGVLPVTDMPDTYPYLPSLDPALSINLGQPSQTLVSEMTGAVGSALKALDIPDFGSTPSSAAGAMITMLEAGLTVDLMSLLG